VKLGKRTENVVFTDAGAIKYRYEVIDDLHDKLSFDAVAPDAALTPIWSKLRVGYATVTVSEDQLRQDVWPNCMFASAFALEELSAASDREAFELHPRR